MSEGRKDDERYAEIIIIKCKQMPKERRYLDHAEKKKRRAGLGRRPSLIETKLKPVRVVLFRCKICEDILCLFYTSSQEDVKQRNNLFYSFNCCSIYLVPNHFYLNDPWRSRNHLKVLRS